MATPTAGQLSPQDYEERKACLEEIKQLSKEQYEALYMVLKQNQIPHTENSNGIFFDLTSLPQQQFTKIKQFLQLCSKQNLSEQERTMELQILRDESVSVASK
jgi:hypothetical protein